jgi:hypothetical protein
VKNREPGSLHFCATRHHCSTLVPAPTPVKEAPGACSLRPMTGLPPPDGHHRLLKILFGRLLMIDCDYGRSKTSCPRDGAAFDLSATAPMTHMPICRIRTSGFDTSSPKCKPRRSASRLYAVRPPSTVWSSPDLERRNYPCRSFSPFPNPLESTSWMEAQLSQGGENDVGAVHRPRLNRK